MILYIIFAVMLALVVYFHNKANTKSADSTLLLGTLLLLLVNVTTNQGGHHFWDKQFHSLIHGVEVLIVVTCMFILGYAFSVTNLKQYIEKKLPDTKWAVFWIIMIVGLMSMVVDNIAMALIGKQLVGIFPVVHPGLYVNIVAASNAGGSPTFTGDTTTFMIANRGYSTWSALGPALLTIVIIAFVSMKQQAKKSLVQKKYVRETLNWQVIGMMVLYICLGVISLFLFKNAVYGFVLGAAYLALHLLHHKHLKEEMKKGLKAGFFLFLLIMGVGQLDLSVLPVPSHTTGFLAGMISSFLDNIPVTQAALDQGMPYPNWGLLAYAVGAFGSANWWASSAGVAMCEEVHPMRSITMWLRYSWWLWIVQPAIYWLFVWIYSL